MGRKLSKNEIEEYRALLRRIEGELAGDIDHLEADAFSGDGVRGSVDNPADSGSDSFAREFSLELLARDEQTVSEIQAALERIDEGTYGRCEDCEAWIPKGRLNAVPHARLCVGCQRSVEEAG